MTYEKLGNLISKVDGTLKSKDLHKFVHRVTGKYEDARDFQKKVKVTLFGTKTPTKAQISDGVDFTPSFDSRGYVKYFNLSEVECNMVMASVSIKHLRDMAKVFVFVKHNREVIEEAVKVVYTNNVENTRARHVDLMREVEQGLLTHTVETRTVHIYEVTAMGASRGLYKKNGVIRYSDKLIQPTLF